MTTDYRMLKKYLLQKPLNIFINTILLFLFKKFNNNLLLTPKFLIDIILSTIECSSFLTFISHLFSS